MEKGKYAFLCILVLLPIFAQCEQRLAKPDVPGPILRVDNLSRYRIEYMHSFHYKDGTFHNGETVTLESGRGFELVVPDNVARINTWYTLFRDPPLQNLWAMNEDFVKSPRWTEDSVYWTVDEAGFWGADSDGEDEDETLICEWRSTGPN